MVLSRLFNSRSFTAARRLSTLTRNAGRKQNILQQIKVNTGRRLMSESAADISVTEGMMWIIFGGIPITAFGVYITKVLREMIESVEAGEVIPGTEHKITNDEWFALKEKAKELGDDEDEDEDEDAATSEETEEVEEAEPVQEEPIIEEEFVILETPAQEESVTKSSKDTIIFVGPPDKE